MELIEVKNIVKGFTVVKKNKGLKGALTSLIKPEKSTVYAVNDISFSIKKGEIVGFIGPNGAGKSTTVKIMSGILHPTSGKVLVDGISPQENRKAVVKNLGVVFGQRTQLYWDLRLGESFELLRRIYQIDLKSFNKNMDIMSEILKINEIIDTPVRQLSLGQRMRGDIAAAMIHSPNILFLDEPTIGLDIEAKHSIRNYIEKINKINNTTVILTTHDLDDVEQLCKRLIVINNGGIIEDGPLDSIVERLAPYRVLIVELSKHCVDIVTPYAEIIKQENLKIWYRFKKNEITAAELISQLAQKLPIRDLSVTEANIEDVVRKVYRGVSNE
ncbi:ATP-binding cassette domain-containing protein [Clostridium chromiireducens]|uniref:ATP-binding cassette domain-containing protein n=1 Tax=Clostridium chromiireducens TaxID=225345 RepID=A0A399IQY7_9CLOT|nr:ATP-binding cassette domain-containing protein [Clostridium chromiireducens]RII35464.1 ATP-binding cassette domain-containing protein [Clostridium chromiireducens]